ncbi:MAG: hypothetical protein AAGC96_20105, partial [Pseudomonadota bacterium]
MAKVKFRPLHDRVVVRRVESEEKQHFCPAIAVGIWQNLDHAQIDRLFDRGQRLDPGGQRLRCGIDL